jgi:hypothetical protein
METLRTNLEIVLDAREKGFVAIPCLAGTKIPAVKWGKWQDEMPPEDLLREWFADPRRNIAIICSGEVVFDCDDPAIADLVIAECGDTPEKVRTPRAGIHLPYRKRQGVVLQNHVKLRGLSIDIRTNGGLRMIPPSRTENGVYEWMNGSGLLPRQELPVARIGWTREQVQRTVRPVVIDGERSVLALRARAYLATVEGAISGHNGHNRCFRAACILVQKFGLSFDEAWPILCEWNEQCEPPFTEKELIHKLSDAIKKRGAK